jgi:hypothetical protein
MPAPASDDVREAQSIASEMLARVDDETLVNAAAWRLTVLFYDEGIPLNPDLARRAAEAVLATAKGE